MMKTETDLDKMSTDELVQILESKTSIKLSAKIKTKRRYVLDLFKNKLHGTEYIRSDEEIKNKIIIKKERTEKKVTKKDCPNCKSKDSLWSQPLPKESGIQGSSWCSKCGFWEIPKKENES